MSKMGDLIERIERIEAQARARVEAARARVAELEATLEASLAIERELRARVDRISEEVQKQRRRGKSLRKRALREPSLHVRCPTCGSEPGEPCRYPSGTASQAHRARVIAGGVEMAGRRG